MGSKAKMNEVPIETVNLDVEPEGGLSGKNSLIDEANLYLDVKKKEGIPVTDSFKQLFMSNYFNTKNLDLAWRKTRGN